MILNIKIQDQYSIYDYSNILLGSFDNIVQGILKANPGRNLNSNLSPTGSLSYDDNYYVSKSPQIQLTTTQSIPTIKYIRAYEGQSLYDVNLMCYSGFDNVVRFLKDNNINSTNDQDVSGITAIFNSQLNSDLSLSAVISKKGYVFTTGLFLNIGFRITDDFNFRITDDGNFRIID